MSKAVLVVGGLVLGVGAIVLFASTAKASPKAPPGPLQFGSAGDTVTGQSGNVWAVAPVLNPGPVAPGVKVMAVFWVNAPAGVDVSKPVIMYGQQGSDKSQRALVLVSSTATPESIAAAKADFLP